VGGKEHPSTDFGVFEEASAVNPTAVANLIAGFEDGVGTHGAVVPDGVVLSNEGSVPRLEPVSDHNSGIDDGPRTDDPACANRCLELARLRPARRLTDSRAILDDCSLTNNDVGIDH
jgi:hypothetical protein